MKTKVFLSDEGFGHIVRQRAVIAELLKIKPDLDITLQTHQHFNFAKENIKATRFINRFNNIVWHKSANNSPDIEKMADYYSDYLKISAIYSEIETKEDYDFLISDSVYEAFNIAEAGLNMEQVGKIEVLERFSYVAVPAKLATSDLEKLAQGRVKGHKVRVSRVK